MTNTRNAVAPQGVQFAFDFLLEVGARPAHDRRNRVVLPADAKSPLKLLVLARFTYTLAVDGAVD